MRLQSSGAATHAGDSSMKQSVRGCTAVAAGVPATLASHVHAPGAGFDRQGVGATPTLPVALPVGSGRGGAAGSPPGTACTAVPSRPLLALPAALPMPLPPEPMPSATPLAIPLPLPPPPPPLPSPLPPPRAPGCGCGISTGATGTCQWLEPLDPSPPPLPRPGGITAASTSPVIPPLPPPAPLLHPPNLLLVANSVPHATTTSTPTTSARTLRCRTGERGGCGRCGCGWWG